SEEIARKAILVAVHDRLLRPAGMAYVREQIARRLGEKSRGIGAERRDREERLRRTEQKRHRLVMAVSDGVLEASLVAQELRDLQAAVENERHAVAELDRLEREPIPLPSLA